MIPLAAQFCVGCGQILDALEPSDSRPSPIAAVVYREKYGVRCTDLPSIEDLCPSCAHILAIRRHESLPETAETAPTARIERPSSTY